MNLTTMIAIGAFVFILSIISEQVVKKKFHIPKQG